MELCGVAFSGPLRIHVTYAKIEDEILAVLSLETHAAYGLPQQVYEHRRDTESSVRYALATTSIRCGAGR
jgi:hypothetical protein